MEFSNLVIHFSVCVYFQLIQMVIMFDHLLIACQHYCSCIKQVFYHKFVALMKLTNGHVPHVEPCCWGISHRLGLDR